MGTKLFAHRIVDGKLGQQRGIVLPPDGTVAPQDVQADSMIEVASSAKTVGQKHHPIATVEPPRLEGLPVDVTCIVVVGVDLSRTTFKIIVVSLHGVIAIVVGAVERLVRIEVVPGIEPAQAVPTFDVL